MGRQTRVDLQCDLHGLTRDEALVELRRMLSNIRRRGGGRLRVIHGCGEVLSEMVYMHVSKDPTVSIAPEGSNAGSSILQVDCRRM